MVSQELVEGVENMQVYYGEDTDGDSVANIYRKADTVTNWSNVVAIRIGLLVRTPGNVDTYVDTKTYMVADTNVGPFNDNRQRRVFSSTIELRN